MNQKRALSLFCLLLFFNACDQKKNLRAVIGTSMGDIRVRLFDKTPRHRDFFEKMIEMAAYDSLFVRRIERDFVIQSGFLNAPPTSESPPSEIKYPLLRGALAMNNGQFFIVQGRLQTDESLDRWEKKMGRKISAETRAFYKKKGGAPQLEGQFTVFGEVTEGMEVVDKIAALPRDADDRPLQEVRMWVRLE